MAALIHVLNLWSRSVNSCAGGFVCLHEYVVVQVAIGSIV